MKKGSPNLTTCTAEEWADWYIAEVKQTGSALIFPNGIFSHNAIHTLTEAFRIIGQREGYKKGKKDGSSKTFQHFFNNTKPPCHLCRHKGICDGKHRTKCEIWLRWLGVK